MSTPNAPQPTLADFTFIHCLAESLLDQAARVGIILTIERKSLAPLAMGHTCAEIRTWPGRTKQQTQARSGAAACVQGLHNVLAEDATPARGFAE